MAEGYEDADHTPFPGVSIYYGEDGAVHIHDDDSEIVMWNWTEVVEDPTAWTASLVAVALASRGEFDKIREIIERPRQNT